MRLLLLSLLLVATLPCRLFAVVEPPPLSEVQREILRRVATSEEKGDTSGAIALLEDFLGKEAGRHAAIALELGNLHHREGDRTAAAKYYATALELLPDYTLALRNQGIVFYEEGRYREALGPLGRSVNSLPPQSDDLLLLAHCQSQLGLHAAALRSAELGVSLYPFHLGLRKLASDACLRLARYDDAVDLLRETLTLSPEDAELWFALASAQTARGRTLEATDAMEAGLLISPGDSDRRVRL
ncbi:MAG: tetratricopeptide repeat protein, partial [Planctomycetes bacterium]|nr:tetratricopeptide repeat protein [Planctomycetota bacterium]